MKLLDQYRRDEAALQEEQRKAILLRLREILGRILPGQTIWLYGSVLQPERFARWSDVDLALEKLPSGISLYGLPSEIAEELGRPVDLVILGETRLQQKIRREGERWTLFKG